MFSGAGGLDIGFHEAGFDVVEMVEIDNRFTKSLCANVGIGKKFSSAKVQSKDIRDYHPENLGDIDFIIGGPPCQTFSAAGRRAAGVSGLQDSRGTLFEEYSRLLKLLQPEGFIFENVSGITGAEKGQAWKQITDAFESAGYNIFYRLLDAADYGVPQHRERIFIVGTKNTSFLFPRPTHGPDSCSKIDHVSAKSAVEDLELLKVPNQLNGRYGHLLPEIPPGLNYSFFTENMGHPTPIFAWRSKFSDFLYKAHPNYPVRTIKAQGGQYTGPFHWDSRPFSVEELKRLQTFPDNYQLVGNRGVCIQQIGNSVPPQQARILALAILDQLFGVNLPFKLDYLPQNQELSFRKRKRSQTEKYAKMAKSAIENTQLENKRISFEPRIYHANIGDNFSFEVSSKEKANYTVQIKIKEQEVYFVVSEVFYQETSLEKTKIKIHVTYKDSKPWSIQQEKISMIFSANKKSVLAAWKALEHELKRLHIKSDLVQLNNYYQYTPLLKIEVLLPEEATKEKFWNIFKAVSESICTRQILSTTALIEIWKLQSKNEVSKFAVELKNIGFEVRNKNTNIQIPDDHYLIPYSFPTLAPESVQRKKSLF
ncbi:DNA cytosine methyltransferase [Aetokthonos hydrillicola]|uniref:DNA cytosine methyltransferase n=1 Tax=Aetokthonos hydrillicola TaxID=1550245 RepID=UPI001ABB0F7E|nr:DNA cytosine methyltransferase [Aetokthonos hydrillicola CCALA 1050]